MLGRVILLSLVSALVALVVYPTLELDFTTSRCASTEGGDCPDRFFSISYFEARHKFRTLADAIGAGWEAHLVHTDPTTGLEYTIDSTVVRGGRSSSLVVHTSGVHGAEGYAGSAIQIAFLEGIRNGSIAREALPTVLLVHAVNPTGMAFFRRFNHHNVDLNRNWFDDAEWTVPLTRDPNLVGYEDLDSMLNPTLEPTVWNVFQHFVRGMYLLCRVGFIHLKATVVTGQYHNPNGVYYGGKETEVNHRILRKILAPFREFVAVATIDVHTGLGPAGMDTLLVDSPKDYAAATKGLQSAGAYAVDCALCGTAEGVGAGYEHMIGGIDLDRLFVNATRIQVTQEFGTRPPIVVFLAIAWENAAYHYYPNTMLHERTRMWARAAFYPPALAWKREVLTRGMNLLLATTRFVSEPIE